MKAKISAERALWSAILLVALVSTAAAAAGAPLRSEYYARLTADEPHYLLTAISLAEDRSLDVSDEQAAQRYRPFHEIRLDPQGKPLAGGRLVAPHDPGLPALLAIPTALGGWLAARLTLSLLAGLLAGLTLWTAVKRFGAGVVPASVTVGLFGASAPLAVYGSQVYPELPAALAVMVVVACLTGKLEAKALVGFALALVALGWLGSKYIPVAGVLAAVGILRLLRAGRRRDLAWLTGSLALAGIAYLAAHLRWYGGLTVYAAGEHFAGTGELSVMGVRPDYLARSVRLTGLFVDRQFGLAAWQPAWLLMLPAAGRLVARRPPRWEALVLPLIAGWLCATYLALTMQGWWWPGRQVVVVLPLAVVMVSMWATGSSRRLAAMAVTGAVGVFNLAWLFVQVGRKQLTLVIDFYRTSNPIYRAVARILPDYQARPAGTQLLHVLWAVACLGLLFASATSGGSGKLLSRLRRPTALAVKRP